MHECYQIKKDSFTDSIQQGDCLEVGLIQVGLTSDVWNGDQAAATEMLTTWVSQLESIPDSKVHGANMGPIWGRQDPGGPHVGSMNFAIWDVSHSSILFRYPLL